MLIPNYLQNYCQILQGEKYILPHLPIKRRESLRVVLKHLHYTTDTDDIKRELLDLGHEIRNITNVRHRQTKEPLNLFFIDLEPTINNKDIYNLTAFQNRIIHFESPRASTIIPQCTRCQQYGHTQRYCNKPYACVKCSGQHNTSRCTRPRDTPTKCVLCGGVKVVNITIASWMATTHTDKIIHPEPPHSYLNKPLPHAKPILCNHNSNINAPTPV